MEEVENSQDELADQMAKVTETNVRLTDTIKKQLETLQSINMKVQNITQDQSKVSLQKKQSKQLFQYSNKGQSDRKKRIKQLFSEESNQFKFVTRTEEPTVSADIGHMIMYLVLISLVLILASIMTFKIKDKKDEYTY
ncbi:TPA: type VII secretion protein EssA [Streptococcus agalactiae]